MQNRYVSPREQAIIDKDKSDLQRLRDAEQHEKDVANGLSPRVAHLKRKIEAYKTRSNQTQSNDGKGSQVLDPKGAYELQEFSKVREGLMSDTKNYFGTLDHAVIRTHAEFSSLNSRQKKLVQAQYPWMIDELTEDTAFNEKLEAVKWVNPLQEAYDKLDEKEQQWITSADQFSIIYALEIPNVANQPHSIVTNYNNDVQDVVYGAPLSSVE